MTGFDWQAVPMSPTREKGISRQGYLTKAPFHGESNGTPGAKVHLFSVNYHSVAFEWVAHFRDSGGKKVLVNRDLNMAGFLIKKFLPYYQK